MTHWLFDRNSVYKTSCNQEHCFLHGLECWSKTHLIWMRFSPTTHAPGLLAETFWAFCSPGSLESDFSNVIPQMPAMQPDFGSDGWACSREPMSSPVLPQSRLECHGAHQSIVLVQWEARDITHWLWLISSPWHYRFVPCSTFSNALVILGIKVLKKLLLQVILHHLIILTIRSFSNWDFNYNVKQRKLQLQP